jgi:hypothetical protein
VPRRANCTTPPSCDRLDDLNKPRLAPPQKSSKNVRRIIVGVRFVAVVCVGIAPCSVVLFCVCVMIVTDYTRRTERLKHPVLSGIWVPTMHLL